MQFVIWPMPIKARIATNCTARVLLKAKKAAEMQPFLLPEALN